MAQEPEVVCEPGWMSKTRIGRFNKGLRSNGAVRRDSVEWDYCKGKYGADGTFYDGTVAAKCIELTKYDTGGRFRMSIRPKSGTFYDENSAFNSSAWAAADIWPGC